MSGGVPLWVTIMLGVLAVIGTIGGAWGGQLIAARRDDKRWERELDREEVRWSRERDRERDQVAREIRSQWRSERLDAYVEALSKFDLWSHSIVGENYRGENEGILAWSDARHQVIDAAHRVEILGSREVIDKTFETVRGFYDVQRQYGDLPTREERVCGGHECTWLVQELRGVMRVDLGVVDAEISESL